MKRLNLSPRGGGGDKVKCQTCTGSHKPGFVCPGRKCDRCFDCGEKGHFKGAPLCKKPKSKKGADSKTKKGADSKAAGSTNKSRRVKSKESSDEDTDESNAELTDSCGRVVEVVGRSTQKAVSEPRVPLSVRARGGTEYVEVNKHHMDYITGVFPSLHRI